jgi:hypothetical protein
MDFDTEQDLDLEFKLLIKRIAGGLSVTLIFAVIGLSLWVGQ